MRMTWPAAVMAVLVAGCGIDPEKGKLPSGSEAMTYSGTNAVVVKIDGVSLPGVDHTVMAAGIKVRVIDDPGGEDPDRDVKANILEGEFSGKVGKFRRFALRPAR